MDILNNNPTEYLIDKFLSSRSHIPSGPIYKNTQKRKALNSFKKGNELEAICSLIESHSPTFRIKTSYRCDRILQNLTNDAIELTLDKEHLEFNCPAPIEPQINSLKNKIKEMPKEWTIVQITTQYNLEECLEIDVSNNLTDPLFLSIFNCGETDVPFCINIPAPKDTTGAKIQLCKEMRTIMDENKNLQKNYFGETPLDKITAKQKRFYIDDRNMLNHRLNEVINQIEISWLKEWRCLFIGKFIDEKINQDIKKKINTVLETDKTFKPTTKVIYILCKIFACSSYISSKELTNAVNYCIPDHKDLKIKMFLMLKSESENFNIKNAKRHPVILIIDEKLDCFSWEMIDVMQDHPVTRMPSLHFTYALFKEHEKTIVDGMKIVSSKNGKYIVNPGLDLKEMEKRLSKFYSYWLPDWEGLIGQTPTSDQFSEYLNGGEIFIYNGHGSGTQFLSGKKIQSMHINSVVFLFGCGSVRMQSDTCLVEMQDVFHYYLTACSPCVVGMLWEVTDYDTDVLSTDLLSRWIPSQSAKVHWNFIDKFKWNKGQIVFKSPKTTRREKTEPSFEPELLRAINQARKAPTYNMTKCGIVARGLPIKINCSNP